MAGINGATATKLIQCTMKAKQTINQRCCSFLQYKAFLEAKLLIKTERDEDERKLGVGSSEEMLNENETGDDNEMIVTKEHRLIWQFHFYIIFISLSAGFHISAL